jgi:hypothetical protein
MVLELAREWYWAKKFWTKENAVYSAFGQYRALSLPVSIKNKEPILDLETKE